MTPAVRILFVGLLVLGLSACTSKPLLNPQEQLPYGQQYSQPLVQKAILAALAKRGWTVTKVEPERIAASLTLRGKHHAEIDIDYNPVAYQIRYRDSWGLGYKDGKIHRNYNRWVANLSKSIQQELQMAQLLQN